jgi:hypothetical protein
VWIGFRPDGDVLTPLKQKGKAMKTIDVTIEGISPLLMNRPAMMDLIDNVEPKEPKGKEKLSGKEDLMQQFETKKYLIEGKLYTPDTHIKGCLVESGKNIQVKGKGKATYSKIIGYAVIVQPAALIHNIQECEPHTTMGININTRGRIIICRPCLSKWELDFQLEFDEEEISKDVLKMALDRAGRIVGIGDWRPAKKGTFGRFIVTRYG